MKKTEYLYIKEYINFIRKALECCSKSKTNGDCMALNCPCFKYGMCIFVDDDLGLQNLALDLINRQKAEIERLGNALLALMNYLNIIGCDKSDVSFIKIATDLNKQIRADIKSQSVKDFAEKLKEEIKREKESGNELLSEIYDRDVQMNAEGEKMAFDSVERIIDNILKEMVGEEE